MYLMKRLFTYPSRFFTFYHRGTHEVPDYKHSSSARSETRIRRFALMITAVVIIVIVRSTATAEFLFLKNGEVLKGKIISEGRDSITFRDSSNKTRSVSRNDIIRVNFTELTLGKVYVQKRDGTSLTGFLVDQNQTTYIFRRELHDTDEITIKRVDVLFIAEKNPSGLTGTPSTDSIAFTWYPPYDKVREYRLYMKKTPKDQYTLAGVTSSKSFTAESLTSNTEYFFIVTSVDANGYESSPSNEVRITTKNILPDPPTDIIAARDSSGGFNLNWSEARDPDGTVTGYRVYKVTDGKEIRIADQKSPGLFLREHNAGDSFFVSSVDDKGDESSRQAVIFEGIRYLKMEFAPVFVFPVGRLGKIAYPGFGAAVEGSFTNTPFHNICLGFETDLIFLKGKKMGDGRSCDRVLLIPLTCDVSVPFSLSRKMKAEPEFSFGAVLEDVKYTRLNAAPYSRKKEHTISIDPVIRTGCAFLYELNNRTSIRFECAASVISSGRKFMPYISVNAGMDYLLW